MKFFILFSSIISSIFCVNRLLYKSDDDHQLISVAVLSLVEKFFIEKSIKFGIHLYGETSSHLNDIFNDFVDQMNTQGYLVNDLKRSKEIWKI